MTYHVHQYDYGRECYVKIVDPLRRIVEKPRKSKQDPPIFPGSRNDSR